MHWRKVIVGVTFFALGAAVVRLWLDNESLREQAAALRSGPPMPVEALPGRAAVTPVEEPGPRDEVAPADPAKEAGRRGRQGSGMPDPRASAPSVVPPDPVPRVEVRPDGRIVVRDGAGSVGPLTVAGAQRPSQELNAALLEPTVKSPGGPSWSPGQAAGAPDTRAHGDYSSAWASQNPDGGPEWLVVKYGKPVEIREINIHETYNPGALARVSAMMPDGSERILWEGVTGAEAGIVERAIEVPPGIHSNQIRIELDTARVPGWNEIDAVELVGRDGSRQWAAESTASSYFGQGRPPASSNGQVDRFSHGALERGE